MIIKNRTYMHLGMMLELYSEAIVQLLKNIQPIQETWIGNALHEEWEPSFHIKGTMSKSSLILLKDFEKKGIIELYKEKEDIMIILKIPEKFQRILYYFIRGEYSKMYTSEQQKLFISNSPGRVEKLNAYNKKENFESYFIEAIKKSFNTPESHINTDNLQECDIPPILSEEILNYKLNKKEFKTKILMFHENYKRTITDNRK